MLYVITKCSFTCLDDGSAMLIANVIVYNAASGGFEAFVGDLGW